MSRSGQSSRFRTLRSRLTATVVLVLACASLTHGRDRDQPPSVPDIIAERVAAAAAWNGVLSARFEETDWSNNAALKGSALGSAAPKSPRMPQRSVRRKVLGAIVGGVGGFFGGGFLGAAIEGDRCNCDDPGLLGFLIGAPVGAGVGSILGYKFLF